jgi:hypothetical protein
VVQTNPVGRNTLATYTRLLAQDVPSMEGKRITNKSRRGTGITRMNQALVPIEKAMETTSHRTMDTYEKYNQEKKYLSERATQRVFCGEIKNGRPILYEDAYKEEIERMDSVKVLNFLIIYLCCLQIYLFYFLIFMLNVCSDQVLLQLDVP